FDDDIWAMSLEGERKEFAIAETDFEETRGRFSPDSRWIAYRSNETGREEIYVRPFLGPGRAVQVSSNGGDNPRWHPAGHELFYVDRGSRVMSVAVNLKANGNVDAGQPSPLFPLTAGTTLADIAPDG